MPYIGTQVAAGNYRKLVDISTGFNGSTTSFTLAVPPGGAAEYYVTPASVNQLLISVGGVIQQPGVDFTVSTYTITFTTAPTAGLTFFGILMGDALSMGAPGDGTVTVGKLADGAVTTAKLANNSVTTAKLDSPIAPVVSSLNGGPLAGSRNRIINGNFIVNQRGGSSPAFTGATTLYGADRWFATLTASPSATVGIGTNSTVTGGLIVQRQLGAFPNCNLRHRIEAVNIADLASKQVTLSFFLFYDGSGLANFTYSIPGATDDFTSVTTTTIAGNVAIGAGAIYTYTFTLPSTATRGLQINIETTSTLNVLIVNEVQLEAGTVATPFERRSYGQELALCQRYYSTESGLTITNVAATTYSNMVNITLPVTMRAAPIVNLSGTNVANTGAVGVAIITPQRFNVTMTSSSGTGERGQTNMSYFASAEL